MDPTHYLTLTVSRGYAYTVYHTPSIPTKPTLLFLHGFSSTSYDWRRQIPYFEARGFGVVAPDMLGAGASAKPKESAAFMLSAIAQDIIDILDQLGLEKVIGVAHDWGAVYMSRLSMLHQARFTAFAWLAVGFREPALKPFDLERAMAEAKALTGYEWYAYWQFFTREDAGEVVGKHVDSFLQLTYARDPAVWPGLLFVRGKAAEHIENDVLLGRAGWLSEEEYDKLKENVLTNGVGSQMLWYTNVMDNNDLEENLKIPQDTYTINVPSLFIGGSKDTLFPEAISLVPMHKYATNLKVVSLDAGHYLLIERADEVNDALEDWLISLNL